MPRYGPAGAEDLLGIQEPRQAVAARVSSVVPRLDGHPCRSRERPRRHGRSLRFRWIAGDISFSGFASNGPGFHCNSQGEEFEDKIQCELPVAASDADHGDRRNCGPLISA